MLKMTRSFIIVFLLLAASVRGDEVGKLSETEGNKIVSSIQALTQSCDQSNNYVGILNAVHSSLDLQVHRGYL